MFLREGTEGPARGGPEGTAWQLATLATLARAAVAAAEPSKAAEAHLALCVARCFAR